jgi:hypothetical protein
MNGFEELCKTVHHAFEYGFHCNDMTEGEMEDDISFYKGIDKWNEYFTYDKRCEYMESRINGEDVSSFVPDKGQSLIKKSY